MRLKYHELAAGLPPLKMTPRGFQSVATSPFLATSRTRARGAGGKRSRQSPRWDGGSAGSESWSVKGLNRAGALTRSSQHSPSSSAF